MYKINQDERIFLCHAQKNKVLYYQKVFKSYSIFLDWVCETTSNDIYGKKTLPILNDIGSSFNDTHYYYDYKGDISHYKVLYVVCDSKSRIIPIPQIKDDAKEPIRLTQKHRKLFRTYFRGQKKKHRKYKPTNTHQELKADISAKEQYVKIRQKRHSDTSCANFFDYW